MFKSDSPEALEESLLAWAKEANLDPEIAAGVLSGVLPAFRESQTSNPSDNEDPLNDIRTFFPKQRWAIRDDEWKLYEAVVSGVAAFAGAGFFTQGWSGPKAIPAAVGIATAVFGLVRNAVRKGSKLNHLDTLILMGLRCRSKGLTEEQVHQLVAVADEQATIDEITKSLKALQRVRVGDNTVTAFVEKDGKGLWAACV